MLNSPQTKPNAQKSMFMGIAEPLYMQDYEMRARKLQAEVVAQAFSSLAHTLSRAFARPSVWVQARLKSVSKKQCQPTIEGAESF